MPVFGRASPNLSSFAIVEAEGGGGEAKKKKVASPPAACIDILSPQVVNCLLAIVLAATNLQCQSRDNITTTKWFLKLTISSTARPSVQNTITVVVHKRETFIIICNVQ
jgi:hypothetical protein